MPLRKHAAAHIANVAGLPTLPKGWSWVRFADLSERVSVGHVGPTTEFFCERGMDGVPLIRSQDVRPGRLMLGQAAHITPEFHSKARKSQLKAGDVLIVRVGANRADCCSVPDGVGDLNCANIVFARPRERSDFFAHFFRSPFGQQTLLSATTGSAQGVINTGSVAAMPVPVPPVAVQRRIAGILSVYDDLIENCERRIRVLDEMARALYREWFVLFRYPGHEKTPLVDSALGRIPKGWACSEVGALSDGPDGVQTGPFGSQLHQEEYAAEGVPVVMPKDLRGFRIDETDIARVPELVAERVYRHRMRVGDIVYGRRGDIGCERAPRCAHRR
jgi:type I restriction enzyme S subunit